MANTSGLHSQSSEVAEVKVIRRENMRPYDVSERPFINSLITGYTAAVENSPYMQVSRYEKNKKIQMNNLRNSSDSYKELNQQKSQTDLNQVRKIPLSNHAPEDRPINQHIFERIASIQSYQKYDKKKHIDSISSGSLAKVRLPAVVKGSQSYLGNQRSLAKKMEMNGIHRSEQNIGEPQVIIVPAGMGKDTEKYERYITKHINNKFKIKELTDPAAVEKSE